MRLICQFMCGVRPPVPCVVSVFLQIRLVRVEQETVGAIINEPTVHKVRVVTVFSTSSECCNVQMGSAGTTAVCTIAVDEQLEQTKHTAAAVTAVATRSFHA